MRAEGPAEDTPAADTAAASASISFQDVWKVIIVQKAIRAFCARKTIEAFNEAHGAFTEHAGPHAVSPMKQQDLHVKQQAVVTGLRKPSVIRNEVDVTQLVLATTSLKFFKGMPKEMHTALVAELEVQLVPKDTTLIEQGEVGATFYILYKGSAKVYVTDVERNWNNYCLGSVEEGDSFGELALISADRLRTATVIVSEATMVLKLPAAAYNRILREKQENEIDAKVSFLQKVFLFYDWARRDLERLALLLTRRTYERNQTVLRQGHATELLYFVVTGRCRCVKWMELSPEQETMLSPRERVGAEVGRTQERASGGLMRRRRRNTITQVRITLRVARCARRCPGARESRGGGLVVVASWWPRGGGLGLVASGWWPRGGFGWAGVEPAGRISRNRRTVAYRYFHFFRRLAGDVSGGVQRSLYLPLLWGARTSRTQPDAGRAQARAAGAHGKHRHRDPGRGLHLVEARLFGALGAALLGRDARVLGQVLLRRDANCEDDPRAAHVGELQAGSVCYTSTYTSIAPALHVDEPQASTRHAAHATPPAAGCWLLAAVCWLKRNDGEAARL